MNDEIKNVVQLNELSNQSILSSVFFIEFSIFNIVPLRNACTKIVS